MKIGIRLVLMSCCTPCSAGAIKQLHDGEFPEVDDFVVLFYNPNIFPETEYQKRLAEQIKYCESLGTKYAVGDYNHKEWLAAVNGLGNEPERGARCSECFKHRFKFAQNWAIQNGYNTIASVFGVSKHKDQNQVDACAISEIQKLTYLPAKWDNSLKQKINQESNFYRQNYCGCEFSFRKV
ncbi:MAG: epoxyqueuosine reductase QueH [Alphaproteobacteria bacterium]|nr:epoxyqueuosine reductase QueH [Alphaproteobacteria bacterium]MBN2675342.1 epoxyqueuosine reductase QueH [Alphaproteobacteria bacterium]